MRANFGMGNLVVVPSDKHGATDLSPASYAF